MQDVEGVELCGTLKTVVAIAAGSSFSLRTFSTGNLPGQCNAIMVF